MTYYYGLSLLPRFVTVLPSEEHPARQTDSLHEAAEVQRSALPSAHSKWQNWNSHPCSSHGDSLWECHTCCGHPPPPPGATEEAPPLQRARPL